MLATPQETADFVNLFKSHGVKQVFQKGDKIIRPGESPPGIFYIEEGLVKAYDISRYFEENLLIIRKTGELFPLIWGITGQERQIIYEALVDTTTWQISRAKFLKYINANPSSLAPVLDMTVEMYRLHSERILNLQYRTVRERIISFLYTMGSRFGVDTPEGLLINVPLRHQDIASSISSTRETTSRELATLERKGWISYKQSLITLRDIAALKKYLS
jgi:CRP-like cAMP-binding protein